MTIGCAVPYISYDEDGIVYDQWTVAYDGESNQRTGMGLTFSVDEKIEFADDMNIDMPYKKDIDC